MRIQVGGLIDITEVRHRINGISCIIGKIITQKCVRILDFDRRAMSEFDLVRTIINTIVPCGAVCNMSSDDIHVVDNVALKISQCGKKKKLIICGDKKYKMRFTGTDQEAGRVFAMFLMVKALSPLQCADVVADWLA